MRYMCTIIIYITRVKGRDDNIIYRTLFYYTIYICIYILYILFILYTRRSCSDAMMIYILLLLLLYTCSDAINNADTSFCRAGKRFIDLIYRYRMSYITSIYVRVCVYYSYVYNIIMLGRFFRYIS